MNNEQMRSDFEAWLDEPHPLNASFTRRNCMPKNDGGFIFAVWQAATLKATAAQAEPVKDMRHVGESQFEAWWADYCWTTNTEITSKQIGRDSYAAGMGDSTSQPAAQAEPPQRQPLTDEQITKLHRDAYTECRGFTTLKTYMHFARAIEAAHGIGARP